jgi:rod shape determining protein RodA
MNWALGRRDLRFHWDASLVLGLLITCGIGLMVLYSADAGNLDTVWRQVYRMGLGLLLLTLAAQVPPELLKRLAPGLYLAGVVLLLGVALFGDTGKGAKRWLDLGFLRFQPSEMMKIAVPLAVAGFLDGKRLPPNLLISVLALTIILVPSVLVARQPDLGTALLIAVSGLFVLFLAGLRWIYMAGAAALCAALAPLMWMFMHDYQRQRLLTLLDPASDPLGSGYHIIQSVIAVGSGGLYGKGWMNGTQSRLEFLPESSTDFIFAVFCEEFGFVGVMILLTSYAFIIFRGLVIALQAPSSFGRLLAGSLSLTFFFYVFVNMGMVIGQLPVVGVPLPLVSYGGTSMVTLMVGFGILAAIHSHGDNPEDDEN